MANKVLKTPMKVIRAMCLYCSNDSAYEVRNCLATGCLLYVWRFGKNPYSTRTMTEEQKRAASERMRKIRSERLN